VDHVRLLLATILTCLCVVDPLNYPLWRRDLITSILCLSSVIASTLSPLLAANTLALVLYYNTPESPGAPRPPPRSFTNVALLTGYHLLGVGVAGFIFVASARVWGKRHLYLLGTVIIIISSAWAGASGHNYNSLLAARFFQGVGLAPFGTLVQRYIFEYWLIYEQRRWSTLVLVICTSYTKEAREWHWRHSVFSVVPFSRPS
jgi:MFS family permease